MIKIKTALSVVVIACLALMAIPKNSFSQTENKILSPAILPAASLVLPLAKGALANEFLVSRNKAFKDFSKSNKNAIDVSWSKLPTGFIMAQFTAPDGF